MLDIESKTLPVMSIKLEARNSIRRGGRNKLETENNNSKTDVLRYDKIFPAYKACRKCTDYVIGIRIPSDHGMGFIREFLKSLGLLPVSSLKVFEKWNASVGDRHEVQHPRRIWKGTAKKAGAEEPAA